MQKILFLRNFKEIKKVKGHHIKVRDYYLHCLHHPQLDPYLYFTPESIYQDSELWVDVPREKIVREIQLDLYNLIFVSGKDWTLLPEIPNGKKIISIVHAVKIADADKVLFPFLSRPAFRICVSPEVLAAISLHAVGESVVINNGVPMDLFRPGPERKQRSMLIWAKKNPALGKRLYRELAKRGLDAALLIDFLPREEFARRLGESDVFIALPGQREGFYLPALEGMASGCAVICSDNVGNRGFCMHGETCLMPKYDDLEQHLAMIETLLAQTELKEKIRRAGMETARGYSLQNERDRFYRFLEKYIL